MSIARGSTLDHSYRYVTLAIDTCEGKQPCGVMYHASQTTGTPFSGYMELAWEADAFLQGNNYPMRSVNQRTFLEASGSEIPLVPDDTTNASYTSGTAPGTGKKATLQLYISHRYSASWQGTLVWLEAQKIYEYQSFLELMHLMNELLSDRASVPATDHTLFFKDMNELAEKLDLLFGVSDSKETSAVAFYRGKNKRATFVIQRLFLENATWQGRVCWKETGRQRYFRSFLELLLMIDTALEDSTVWTRHKEQAVAL